MRLLITGGAGYIGSHVHRLLHRQEIPILTYDDFSTGHKEFIADGAWIEGDITNSQKLCSAFSHFRPDAVIHLAALATQGDCLKRPLDCHRINVEGTRYVLEAMRRHGVRHIIFAGSCAVYAPCLALEPMEEKHPLQASSPYGASKLEAERLLAAYEKNAGIRFVIFRMFNVAGADVEGGIGECHSPETHLLPLAIATALGRQPGLNIYGNDYPTPDGTTIRDYVHVQDVAEAFARAAKYLAGGGTSQTLNLGSGAPVSIAQLLAAMERMTGKAVPAAIKSRREGDAPWLWADMARTKAVLGWQPELSGLDTIIRTAWQWQQSRH